MVWSALRLITLVWAMVVSATRSVTNTERAIALWPPSSPWGRWLYHAFVVPWERWDVAWYLQIVQHGYQRGDGTAQFHPLFPWSALLLAEGLKDPLLGLMLAGSLASGALVLAFGLLARLDLDRQEARTAALALLTAPLAFVLFAPYSEALFLLLAVGCFWFLRHRSWWAAGAMGGLAALTRQQGILLLFPALWELWEAHGRRFRRMICNWRAVIALTLIPGGLLLWLVYRAWLLGDVRPDSGSFQSLIYSLLISPSAAKVVPVQAFLWPWQALRLALSQVINKFDYHVIIDLSLGFAFILVLIGVWKHLRISYRIYAVSITLISFAYYTGPVYPYMGLPRHLYLAFPVFIGLGAALHKEWHRLVLVGIGALGMLLLLMLYVLQGWVP